MKNKESVIPTIIIAIVLVVGLLAVSANYITNKIIKSNIINTTLFEDGSNELVVSDSYETNFNELNIKSNFSDIIINENDEDKISIAIYGNKEKTHVNENGDKLEIETTGHNCIGFCTNTTSSKIEIAMPKDIKTKINITSYYGDVKIANFKNSELIATMEYGNMNVMSIKTSEITNNYGDVNIDGHSEKLAIVSKSGDVKVNEVDTLDVTCDYNDISIKKVNAKLNIINDLGEITVGSVDLKEESTIKTNYGNIQIGFTNQIYIDAKSNVGNVRINNNYKDSEIIFKLESNFGDIKVNN